MEMPQSPFWVSKSGNSAMLSQIFWKSCWRVWAFDWVTVYSNVLPSNWFDIISIWSSVTLKLTTKPNLAFNCTSSGRRPPLVVLCPSPILVMKLAFMRSLIIFETVTLLSPNSCDTWLREMGPLLMMVWKTERLLAFFMVSFLITISYSPKEF